MAVHGSKYMYLLLLSLIVVQNTFNKIYTCILHVFRKRIDLTALYQSWLV